MNTIQFETSVLISTLIVHDGLEITYTNIRSLLTSLYLGEALTKGLFVLNELGIALSGDLETLLTETNRY